MKEIIALAQFLILTGLVLPLLPSEPVTTLTNITPRQAWFALLVVCTLSYASYLAQHYRRTSSFALDEISEKPSFFLTVPARKITHCAAAISSPASFVQCWLPQVDLEDSVDVPAW
jgi:hypothetical protein